MSMDYLLFRQNFHRTKSTVSHGRCEAVLEDICDRLGLLGAWLFLPGLVSPIGLG